MSNYKKEFSDDHIAANQKARSAPPSCLLEEVDMVADVAVVVADKADGTDVTVAVVGEVKKMDLDTVEEDSPKTACLVDGKAYAVCKDCVWNIGCTAYTTGACEVSGQRRYNPCRLA